MGNVVGFVWIYRERIGVWEEDRFVVIWVGEFVVGEGVVDLYW